MTVAAACNGDGGGRRLLHWLTDDEKSLCQCDASRSLRAIFSAAMHCFVSRTLRSRYAQATLYQRDVYWKQAILHLRNMPSGETVYVDGLPQ